MNLITCPECGVVLNLDVFKVAKNENQLSMIGFYISDSYATEFFCPCCKKKQYLGI